MEYKWKVEMIGGPGPNEGLVTIRDFVRFGPCTCGNCGYPGHSSDDCPVVAQSRAVKLDKLALMEELLAFMRRFEWSIDDDYCESCGGSAWAEILNDISLGHKPDCKDTARRKELEVDIANLKSQLDYVYGS